MAPDYSQDNGSISITTPLGKDVLLFVKMVGDEALSKPFLFVVDMTSTKPDIAASAIVRKSVTLAVDLGDGTLRYVNGIVRRFVQLDRGKTFTNYRAEIVPTFWLLSLSADSRIYQDKSVPDIVKAIFGDFGLTDFRMDVTGTHNPRTYCVQYRETHMDFVSRLCEEEGIYYYFEHADGKHTLVFADAPSSVKAGPRATLDMGQGLMGAVQLIDTITEFEIRSYVSSGEVNLLDYNDETPKTKLLSTSTSIDGMFSDSKNVITDYPGKFGTKSDGDAIAKTRIEEQEATANTVAGATNYRGMATGQKFTLAEHYNDKANKPYHVIEARHVAVAAQYRSAGSAEDQPFKFETKFVAMPAATPYRPPRITQKAIVHGSQTAVVVGPSGEEIYVDKYSRVKVQFFWDQKGTMDDKSSCWVRVSSVWAGKQWGFIQIPRVGQEVIVDFLEGDPDRPIITGRVYNADQMPPYALPANGTQSGLKTRSSKGGGTDDFNELRFEDKKGSEEVYLHSQKDFNAYTENDESWQILHDRTTTIKNDETKTVSEGNEATTISKGNQTLTVDKGTQTITVEGDRSITIKTGKDALVVKTGDMTTEVSTGNQTNTVKTGNQTTEVSMGNQTTTVKMGNISVKASAGAIAVEGMQSIELKVGGNSITIDQTGVAIKGLAVKIEGSITTDIKAPMTTVKGDGMLTLKGGVTMIN